MLISQRGYYAGQIHFLPRALVLQFVVALVWLLLLSAAPVAASIDSEKIAIPEELGVIQSRHAGTAGQPFIFIIGEEHVSLKVQQTVANILRYLSGVYDVRLVCTEGYNKSLVIPSGGTSLVALRYIAYADFMARRISGVEYFARAFPKVSVVGVEDMTAYQAHGKQLDVQGNVGNEAKQWNEDFKKFILEDIGNLRVSEKDAKRFQAALKKLVDDKDFGPLTQAVYDIAGRGSPAGKKLTQLNERREALEKVAKVGAANSPEMLARDQAMVKATLGTIKEKGVEVAILVVGKLHLEGIEKQLRTSKMPFVSIVPKGVEEKLTGEINKEDQRIYEEWRKGTRGGLEAWLTHFKPEPALSRPDFGDRSVLLGVLATADLLRRGGTSAEETLNVIQRSPLPRGITIDRVFDIADGQGMEFSANGKKGYVYFGGSADQVKAPQGPVPVETGETGGRYFAVYCGGGSMIPPIPPTRVGGGSQDLPPSQFNSTYVAAIGMQREQQKQRVTIAFLIENGTLVRKVDDGLKIALNISPSQVDELRKRYQSAKLGPDTVFAAQQLADALLIDLNSQLPEGRKELIQISENDLIGDISLPMVLELAGNEDASRLNTIDKSKVYTVAWEKAKQDMSFLGRQIDDNQVRDKNEAKDRIREQTGNVELKEFLARPLSELEKQEFAPKFEQLARASQI